MPKKKTLTLVKEPFQYYGGKILNKKNHTLDSHINVKDTIKGNLKEEEKTSSASKQLKTTQLTRQRQKLEL